MAYLLANRGNLEEKKVQVPAKKVCEGVTEAAVAGVQNGAEQRQEALDAGKTRSRRGRGGSTREERGRRRRGRRTATPKTRRELRSRDGTEGSNEA